MRVLSQDFQFKDNFGFIFQTRTLEKELLKITRVAFKEFQFKIDLGKGVEDNILI